MQIVIDIPQEVKQAFDRANNDDINFCFYDYNSVVGKAIKNGTVLPEKPIIYCKDCAYFEYDVVKNVDGIPLIVAHEMCSKWGDGCKTRETGFCYLALAKKKGGSDANRD